MSTAKSEQGIELNIAMDLVRVTEAAAIAGVRFMGMGDKESVDQSAVDAMRLTLDSISMDGVVVIGEGEKDEAPMLYIGERVGDGLPPQVDIAVDPIDGTTLLSKGLPGAVSAIALSARGTMNVPKHVVYMNKIAVGEDARDAIDINASVEANIKNVAEAKRRKAETLTVVALDRPRHEQLLESIRAAGARVKLITDGDVAAGIQAALPGSGVDMLMGIGGAPDASNRADAETVAATTVECFKQTIPAAIPGVVFLSGGQSDDEATVNPNPINLEAAKVGAPWALSFSFGRGLQSAPLKAWAGKAENVPAAQAAFKLRARLTSAAQLGKYFPDMEKQSVTV